MSKSIKVAITEFDRINSNDPKKEVVDGTEVPFELAFSDRLTSWVNRLTSTPSDALQLACRCQHIERWTKPRDTYPMNKTGYLKWRSDLKSFHTERSSEVLESLGFELKTIEALKIINQKKAIKLNSDAQIMEDALCLEFLDHQLEKFAAKYPEEKIIVILKKSWKKMSEDGRAIALKISFTEADLELVKKAIS
ncbi:MAG: DUF4202 domain-containing protein [Flavobacteriales bacterium]|nr:DUF4202 domain-containing protein [Flavobacteriales bacterium]